MSLEEIFEIVMYKNLKPFEQMFEIAMYITEASVVSSASVFLIVSSNVFPARKYNEYILYGKVERSIP